MIADGPPPADGADAAVRAHVAAFNARDRGRLFAGLAADVVWATGADVFHGITALADLFDERLWDLDPALEIVSLVSDGTVVAAELGEVLTIGGVQRSFAIAAFFIVGDGVIHRAKIYREGSADLD